MTGSLLVFLTALETSGGLLSLLGSGMVLIFGLNEMSSMLLEMGLLCIALALIGLMIGQRLAKDYAGASSLVGYCILLFIGFLSFTILAEAGLGSALN